MGQLDVRASPPGGCDDLDLAQRVELFRPFGGVEKLRVVDELVLDIARALEPDPELFPALRELSLGNSREFTAALEAIAPFISVRQLSGHPIIVYGWDTCTFEQWGVELRASQGSWRMVRLRHCTEALHKVLIF